MIRHTPSVLLCFALTLGASPLWADDYSIRVAVDQVKAGFQRGKSPDRDYLTVYGSSTHDLSSRANSAATDIGEMVTNRTVNLSPAVMTDEILVSDSDTIEITASISNKSHTDSNKALSDSLKIAGLVIGSMGAGEVLAASLMKQSPVQAYFNKEGAIVSLVGIGVSLAGEALSDLGESLGLSDPDCDGFVFFPKLAIKLKVGEFFAAFSGPIPLNTPLGVVSWTDDTQASPPACGHTPSATIRMNLVLTKPPIRTPTFSGTPVGPPTHFRPIANALRRRLPVGLWAERDMVEGSRVVVDVSRPVSLGGPTFSIQRAAGPAAHVDSLAVPEPTHAKTIRFKPDLLGVVGGAGKAQGMVASSSLASRALVSVTEQIDSAAGPRSFRISDASAVETPMQTSIFRGNQFPSQVVRFANAPSPSASSALGAKRLEPEVTRTISSGSLGVFARNQTSMRAPAFADSLPLSDGVTLQTYGGYDARERFAGLYLRYLRTDGNGRVLTDVMLRSAQHVPR